ncbi:hypothetical protein SNE40_021488 [Patella caerulea]|uniref:Failed axon connections homolog n=2 Tax=Patella caerulea TaxID=87958 RepID=A0AAN8FZQ9_PATCE
MNKDNHWLVLAGTGAVLIGGITAYKMLTKRQKKSWPKDTIVLHSVDKGIWDMSLTPFAVKLETYFRLADIPYINNPTNQQSSKKKIPWIEYNGETVADSAFIIEYLNKKLALDLNMHLTQTERAIGRAFSKMMEDNTYWTMVLSRWYHDIYKVDPPGLGLIGNWLLPLAARMMYKQGWQQGMGRHSRDEVLHIMEEDLKAVSLFLGKNKFLFGEKPCEVDCAVFGQLSQFCWHMPGLYGETLIHEKYPNLKEYCYRMKKAFWPELGTKARSKLDKK